MVRTAAARTFVCTIKGAQEWDPENPVSVRARGAFWCIHYLKTFASVSAALPLLNGKKVPKIGTRVNPGISLVIREPLDFENGFRISPQYQEISNKINTAPVRGIRSTRYRPLKIAQDYLFALATRQNRQTTAASPKRSWRETTR